MPSKYKVGCSKYPMNTCFQNVIQTDKVSWAEIFLAGSGILGRKITGWERNAGPRNLLLGKIYWA